MDSGGVRDKLLIPGIEQIDRLFDRISFVICGLEQGILLFNYAVVIGNCLNIRRMDRDYRPIEKFAPRVRRAANDLKLVGVKHDRVKLPKITLQRLTFAVYQKTLCVALQSGLQIAVDVFGTLDAAADYREIFAKTDRLLQLRGPERTSGCKNMYRFQPICLALSVKTY